MLWPIVLVFLFWLVLAGLFFAGTLFLQAYIYSEPVEGLLWRAPAAAGAVSVFLLIWVWLDYRAPGKYRALFEFSARQDLEPFRELRITGPEGKQERYLMVKTPEGKVAYRLEGRPTGKTFPSRPDKIVAIEDGKEVVFEPDRDEEGNFQIEKAQSLVYRDSKDRVIVEGAWGQVSIFRTGRFIANLIINFIFFVLWVVALWLLLDFQFWHAFGLAIGMWAVLILFIIPPLLSRTETIAIERGREPAAKLHAPLLA